MLITYVKLIIDTLGAKQPIIVKIPGNK